MQISKLLLAIFVVTFILTSVAYATDFEIEKHANQARTIVKYDGNATSLDIPSIIEGEKVPQLETMFFKRKSLASITAPASIILISLLWAEIYQG